ncbi:unnamed protein product [Medioppia subpectinata]|uniref:NADH-ubiquinone oxidoreductase 15 kDa subunit n=1 Tax=Medioppia subpectinata TaxID=1979941 RepID=A0A7R9L6C5_9ACAR|nr:unnamed protein product [Medioppia subpectinata]CAG2115317.1 unnamed protein product [Medioppia subpectinata]
MANDPLSTKFYEKPMHGFPEGPFRSNISEIFGHIHATQCQIGNSKPRCAEFQLNAVECLEAYGAKRGRRVCSRYLDDYQECIRGYKQSQRVNEMTKERLKQVMRGERTLDNYHDKVKPPRDAYQFGPFHP